MSKIKEYVPAYMYKDQIWKIYDDDSEELIWENELRNEYWQSDEATNSEYHKMMELERETDFWQLWEELDWWFEHRTIRVYMKGKDKGKEEVIKYSSLLEEFAST